MLACHDELKHALLTPTHWLYSILQGKGSLAVHWGPSLYHLDDLPFGEGLRTMPSVFTPFRDAVEKKSKVREAGACRSLLVHAH